jgi:hypothetical protein
VIAPALIDAIINSGYPKSPSQAVGAGPCACPVGAHLAFVDNLEYGTISGAILFLFLRKT